MVSLKKNAILNIARNISSLLSPLITFPYVSHVLQPDALGRIQFSLSIISYFLLIASLGVGNYGIREGAKIRDNHNEFNHFATELFIINMISTFIAYSLLICSIFFIRKLSNYSMLLFIFMPMIFCSILGMDWLYQAEEDFEYITIRSLFFQFLGIVCIFIFIKSPRDYFKYAMIISFSTCATGIINFIHAKKYIRFSFTNKIEITKHLKSIFLLFTMVLVTTLYTILDVVMLGFLSNDAEVAYYHVATKINRLVLTMITAIGTVILPRFSYYNSQTDKSRFYELLYKSFEITFLIALPSLFGLELLSEEIIMILSGSSFVDAIPAMRIINPIILIVGLSNVIGIQFFLSINKERWTLISVLGGSLSNFLCNFLLIPHYGALGAGIGTICAESIVLSIQIFFSRHIINFRKIFRLFIKYLINAIIMSLSVIACKLLFSQLLLRLIFSIIIGAGFYFLVLISEKNIFANMLVQFIYKFLRRIKKHV